MNDTFIAKVDCKDKNSLVDIRDAVAKALNFPNYYGKNWDAWDECMRDLDWLQEEAIYVELVNFNYNNYPSEYIDNKSDPHSMRRENTSARFFFKLIIGICDFWSDKEFVESQYAQQKVVNFKIKSADEVLLQVQSSK